MEGTGYWADGGVEGWDLSLSRYARDNLLWLLEAVGGDEPVGPFAAANTGDWVGELRMALRDGDDADVGLARGDRPNMSLDELRDRVALWRGPPLREFSPEEIALLYEWVDALIKDLDDAGADPAGQGAMVRLGLFVKLEQALERRRVGGTAGLLGQQRTAL